MPKVLEHIRENLLQEARKQVMEQGYSSMTIRSVASACGVGVGTVYNYFASKEMLVAGFLLKDWDKCRSSIEQGCRSARIPDEALRCIYDALNGFMEKYSPLFRDESAGAGFGASFRERHRILRTQVAEPLIGLCRKQLTDKASAGEKQKVAPEFLAEFLAEALLNWTREGTPYEQVSAVLLQLL